MVMPKIKHRWGRWWLDTTRPYTLCIENTPGHIHGELLANFRDKEHRQRWIQLVTTPTPGITAQDIVDLEEAISDLIAAGVIKPLPGWL